MSCVMVDTIATDNLLFGFWIDWCGKGVMRIERRCERLLRLSAHVKLHKAVIRHSCHPLRIKNDFKLTLVFCYYFFTFFSGNSHNIK